MRSSKSDIRDIGDRIVQQHYDNGHFRPMNHFFLGTDQADQVEPWVILGMNSLLENQEFLCRELVRKG